MSTNEDILEFARLGEWDITQEIDCDYDSLDAPCADKHVDIMIEESIGHPNYSKALKKNDIALLRLAQKVNFTAFINPICLPSSTNEDLTGEKFIAAGK